MNIQEVLKEMFSGYSFRGKIEHNPSGDIGVVQMKDLQNDYTSISSSLTKVDSESIPTKYLLKQGDILFLAKGSNNPALTFNQANQPVVAAAVFFVLRPDQSKVIPEYLTWYMNQKPVQQYLKDHRAGTYIANVNKSTVEDIQIQLPEIGLQEKIVKIDFLRKREYLLMNQLLEKREMLVSHQLLKILN